MPVDSSEVQHLAADLYAAPAKIEGRSAGAVHDSTHSTARDAEAFAPVFTGHLKDGIEVRTMGLLGEVVSTADYSDYVEEGTSDTAPQPFMGPALELNAPGLERHLGNAGEDIL